MLYLINNNLAMKNLEIGIACDHAGYLLKEKIKGFLQDKGVIVKDFGTNSEESVDYPDFIHPLALAIENSEFSLGIAICGSGNGVSMTANKHQKVRAALCWNSEISYMARLHNNANICALPARYIDERPSLSREYKHNQLS